MKNFQRDIKRKASGKSYFEYIPTKEEKGERIEVALSRWTRLYLFILLVLFRIGIDLDTGIFVASYDTMEEQLGLNDTQFAMLNSVLTFGKLVALLCVMFIINIDKRKYILMINAFLNGLSLLAYYFSNNFYYMCALRTFGAFNRVFIDVYIPIWTDQFGMKNFKTTFLSIHFVIESYGKVTGSYMVSLLFQKDWKKCLYTSGAAFLTLSLMFSIIPYVYFSTKYQLVEKKQGNSELQQKLIKKGTKVIEAEKKLEEEAKKEEAKGPSAIKKLGFLLCTGSYVFCTLARFCVFFIQKVISTFIKQYAVQALKFKNDKVFSHYYALISAVAPLCGSLMGSLLIKPLGGYKAKNSIWLVLTFSALCLYSVISLRKATEFKSFVINIVGYFFTVSAYLPTMNGYLICALDKEMKGLGNSIDRFLATFGKFIGPIVYGMINGKFKHTDPFFAWNSCLMLYYLCFVFVILGCISKYKTKEDVDEKKIQKITEDVELENKDNEEDNEENTDGQDKKK